MSSATTNIVKALERFFGGFGLDVWPEENVPAGAAVPYVTVQLVAPGWRGKMPFFARLWYRDYNYDAIGAKADEIRDAIGECACVPTGAGAVYIYAEDNFVQFQPYRDDPTLKCAYLSMSLMAHTD